MSDTVQAFRSSVDTVQAFFHMAGNAAVAGAAEYLNQKLNGECVNALSIKAAAFGGLMHVSGFGKTVAAVTSSGFSGAASMGAAIGNRMSRSGR